MNIHDGSRVELVKLQIHRHKKNIIVEDVLAKEYYEMSPAGADAIEAIQGGAALGEIEADLKRKYPDEDIDVKQFVADLIELGLVAAIDGQVIGTGRELLESEPEQRRQIYFFHALGKFLFRTPFILVYVAAFVYSMWMIFTNPQLRPEPHSMHLVESMTINVIIWAGTSLFLLALHEFSHFLAARAYHIPATYDIGHRFYFLVLETQLTEIWKLEPRQRIIPYLAGVMNDFVMLALTLTLRVLYPEMNDMLYDILELTTFYLIIMIVFQTCVFMKTDLYYVIETLSGHLNLQERALSWLKQLFKKHKEKEPAFVKGFALFYSGGIVLAVWFFIRIGFPQFLHFLDHAMDHLSYHVTHLYFWDGILFVFLNGLALLFLFYSWIRSLVWYMRSRSETVGGRRAHV